MAVLILASLHEVKEGCSFIKGSEEAHLFQTNLEIRDRSLMFATDNQNIQLMKESLQNFLEHAERIVLDLAEIHIPSRIQLSSSSLSVYIYTAVMSYSIRISDHWSRRSAAKYNFYSDSNCTRTLYNGKYIYNLSEEAYTQFLEDFKTNEIIPDQRMLSCLKAADTIKKKAFVKQKLTGFYFTSIPSNKTPADTIRKELSKIRYYKLMDKEALHNLCAHLTTEKTPYGSQLSKLKIANKIKKAAEYPEHYTITFEKTRL